jgi:quercetin dioxygenase-like cupin family protein
MINRRQAMKAAGAIFPLNAALLGQTAAQEQLKRTNLMTQDLPPMDGQNLVVTVQQLEYAPGGSSDAHRHNGCTFVYVLEGALVAKLDDGPEKTYTAGQMFYEQPMHLHAVSRNASQTQPVKFLVFRAIEKGKPATVPAK